MLGGVMLNLHNIFCREEFNVFKRQAGSSLKNYATFSSIEY